MNMSDGTVQLLVIIFGGIFIMAFAGVGVYLLIRLNKDKQKVAASLDWPSAPGRVIDSRVRESSSTDSEGDETISYYPEVAYEYEVLGSPFRGDKLYIGLKSSSSSYKKASETIAQYPLGKTVAVYYNPDDPNDAVLERRAKTTTTLVLAIIFLAVGLGIGLPVLILVLFSLRSAGA